MALSLRRSLLHAALAALLGLVAAGRAAAVPPGSPTSIAALDLCSDVDEIAEGERDAALARGLALAEAAVATDERDARGHFALFCHLGKRIERSGISFRQLTALRRLRRELDITLALVPGDPDALAAKGALLLKLPRLLGGDAAEAEVLLRRALEAEPDNTAARCYLAEVLRVRGVSSAAAEHRHC